MTDDDVPSGVDFRDPAHTAAWVAEAERVRPWRPAVRGMIAKRVAEAGRARVVDAASLGILDAARLHVLELGPGPGWLAETILETCDVERYVLFDFAAPMLELARQRLDERFADRVQYVLGDFLDPGWAAGLEGPFDAVVTMQAAHELRHKRKLPALYRQVHTLMRPGSLLVVCDHEPKDARPLHATASEQVAAIEAAGFTNATTVAPFEGMYLCAAVC